MSYSTTTSIVCASLAGLVLLIFLIVRMRQGLREQKEGKAVETPRTEETAQPAAAPQVVPAIVPAAGQVGQGQAIGIPVMGPAPVQAPSPVSEPAPEKPGEAQQPGEAEEEEEDQPVTSKEIVTFMQGLSPVEAELAKEKFKGSAVEWNLYYSSMLLKGSSSIEVTLLNANNDYPGVSFIVGLNQYPQLHGIRWGAPVTVRGEISSVYSNYIILDNVELSFPESTPPNN